MPLQKWLTNDEANYVMREIHESLYVNHFRARSLCYKITRQDFIGRPYFKMLENLQRHMTNVNVLRHS